MNHDKKLMPLRQRLYLISPVLISSYLEMRAFCGFKRLGM